MKHILQIPFESLQPSRQDTSVLSSKFWVSPPFGFFFFFFACRRLEQTVSRRLLLVGPVSQVDTFILHPGGEGGCNASSCKKEERKKVSLLQCKSQVLLSFFFFFLCVFQVVVIARSVRCTRRSSTWRWRRRRSAGHCNISKSRHPRWWASKWRPRSNRADDPDEERWFVVFIYLLSYL